MDLFELSNSQRQMAAKFIALVDKHAAFITTSDLYTENLVNAYKYAEHMVAGGCYARRESQLIFTQLNKLEAHFA